MTSPRGLTVRNTSAKIGQQGRVIFNNMKMVFPSLVTLITAAGITGAFLVGCSGSTASTDTQQQATQAQSTPAAAGVDGGRRGPDGHHHGPPAEAFTACEGKAVNDTCNVQLGGESLAGRCVSPPPGAPADVKIACRPDKTPEPPPGHGPGRGHGPHGPPPAEAFNACDGKAADSACTVTLRDHTMEGTCKAPPPGVSETRLACAPARPPQGPPSQAPAQK